MPRRSLGFEVGSNDHLLRAMESKLDDVLSALGEAQTRWEATESTLRQQVQGLEKRLLSHDSAVDRVGTRIDANHQECLGELRKLQSAVAHFRPALAGSPISEVLGTANGGPSEAPAVHLAQPVAQQTPTPKRKKKKVVRSAPQKNPPTPVVEETPLDEGNGLDLGAPSQQLVAVDHVAPLDPDHLAPSGLQDNDIGLPKRSSDTLSDANKSPAKKSKSTTTVHQEPASSAEHDESDVFINLGPSEPFDKVFGNASVNQDTVMSDVPDEPQIPLPPEDNELEELPDCDIDTGEHQQYVETPLPTLEEAQEMPLSGDAVLDGQFGDDGVEEMELDSSAIPKTPTRKPAKKRKRSKRAYDSDDEIDDSDSYVEEVEVTPSRSATPSRSPSSSQRNKRIVPEIPLDEAAALVDHADELKTKFFHEVGATCPKQVRELYQKAADRGNNPTAMLRLARLLLEGAETLHPDGKRIDSSINRALVWKRKLAAHDDADLFEAEIKVLEADIIMKKDRPKKKELDEARKKYEDGVAGGANDAEFKLGNWYFDMSRRFPNNKNAKKNLLDAVKHLDRAVNDRSAAASALLGSIYENHGNNDMYNEVIEEYEKRKLSKEVKDLKAKRLYFESAAWGSGAGENDCATCFEVAFANVKYDFDMAALTYQQAFEKGYAGAAANLATLYETGGRDNDRIDLDLACKWFEIGAKVRCPNATYHLGVVYNLGNLKDRDVDKAIELYEKSIQLAEKSRSSEDIDGMARQELERILVVCVLNEEGKNVQRCRDKLRSKRWSKVMKETQRYATWIVASNLKPSQYGKMPSAVKAPNELDNVLGEENSKVIRDALDILCDEEKNAATVEDRKEAQRQLRLFVPDEKMQKNLGIYEPDVVPVSLYNYD